MAAAKKAPAKKSAKAAAKKAAPKKAPAKKTPAKKVPAKKAPAAKGKAAKKPVKPVAKAPARPTKVPAKALPKPAKAVAKAQPVAAEKPAPKKAAPRPVKVERAPVSFAPAPIGVTPAPVAPRPVPAPSPKDLAAAHEYLLARSATRSEEPVMVNGKRLPTEGELLKMPESAYMNEQQLAFFKHRLQQMESELLQNADETTEHLRETVIVPDPADRATIEEEHALELRTRDRERKLLKKVQQSLARIEAGDYGYCEETGDPIGIPRLLARPTATLSLEAQQRREIKQKMFGD
ncbi:MAG TPA: RNA polymerase-binding protein DksA [Burkholderiaceae bacterium]|nr:RNA polymerase-binding protein DksA [Burkholderiaceae bacterium]HQR76279.1 RNA polymerase-binding protein DksA [Burkholderiaceae bacterium]